jgi:hypothetical protein
VAQSQHVPARQRVGESAASGDCRGGVGPVDRERGPGS